MPPGNWREYGDFSSKRFQEPNMPTTNVPGSARPSRTRGRKLWRYGVAVLILAGVGWYIFYSLFLAENLEHAERLRAAIAEADRLDPGWRAEELEARRQIPPPEEDA